MCKKSQNKLTVSRMCGIAGVSRSGYYSWLNQEEKRLEREQQDRQDFQLLLKAYTFKNRYKGARGIKMVLFRQYDVIMNLKKIRRLMEKFHLKCPIRKPNTYTKIGKSLKSHTVKNILDRNFNQGVPGKVLLTDITYLYYGQGKCAYLSTIKDGCTRQIPAYCLSKDMKTTLVTNTLHILKSNQKYEVGKGALFHSDQGVQYTSFDLKEELVKQKLIQSMSRQGNCWDNAPQESFYGHMKDELRLDRCKTFSELKEEIDSYIEYYNRFRYQWDLEQMAPDEYYTYKTTGNKPY